MFGNVTCTSKRPTSIFQNFLHSEEFALDKIGDWVLAQGTKFHDHPLLFSAFSYKGKRIMNILSTAYNCLDSQTSIEEHNGLIEESSVPIARCP